MNYRRLVMCTLVALLVLAPAVALGHPDHAPVPAPTTPGGSDSGNEGDSSTLAIVGTVVGLLAVGGLLAWLKVRDSRARAQRAAVEGDAPAPAQEVLERTGFAALSRRRRVQIAAGGSAAVLASLGLLLLFGPGGGEPNAPPNLNSLQHVDGTLVVVEERRLVLEPFEPVDGRTEIEFAIREEDARYFDIAHLRSHSSVALPTRLYYEKSGDGYFARYKEDAPANSSGAQ